MKKPVDTPLLSAGFMEWALWYAGQGLAVFPLRSGDKAPVQKGGFKNATKDPELIRSWWTCDPGFNIGIACGKVSGGLVVIDLDKKPNVNGVDTLRGWEADNGQLPITWKAETGSGGIHLLYRDPSEWKNRTGLYPGVDVRGEGGYIVAPPSIHPNGRRYEWRTSFTDIAEVNAVVRNFLAGPVPDALELHGPFMTPSVIPDGQRNHTLFKLACSMRARGDAEEAITAAVEATNLNRCSPPLDDGEVKMIISSALRYKGGTAPYPGGADVPRTDQRNIDKAVKDYVTVSDLMNKELPPPKIIVDNLFSAGLTVFAAPPKSGKSLFVLDMAAKIAAGEPFLGFSTHRCGVCYLALEDSLNRIQGRFRKMRPYQKAPENMYIFTEALDMGSGLIQLLERFRGDHPEVGLFIIDTLAKIRGEMKRNESSYAYDYREAGALHKFALDRGIGVFLVHHTRQQTGFKTGDPFERISGTNGLIGAADSQLVLYQEKREKGEPAKLSVTGRDIPREDYVITLNENTLLWSMSGTEAEMAGARMEKEFLNSHITKTIMKLLASIEGGAWKGRPVDLSNISVEYGTGYIINESSQAINKFLLFHLERFSRKGVEIGYINKGNASRIIKLTTNSDYKSL